MWDQIRKMSFRNIGGPYLGETVNSHFRGFSRRLLRAHEKMLDSRWVQEDNVSMGRPKSVFGDGLLGFSKKQVPTDRRA